jgi:p-hydroxybenzoate 3-monooxygenase
MPRARTQVGIIGSGPAGLLLGQLLHLSGIDTVILERRDRSYVEGRIRAGVLEQGAADALHAAKVGERMDREGLVHHGVEIAVNGERFRIDLSRLTGGQSVIVYGQTEVTKDLISARLDAGAPLVFEAEDVSVHDFDSDSPLIRYRHNGEEHELACDFIAGCDGFHGICRQSVPAGSLTTYERAYPFAWLGILARAKPVSDELIYAYHDRGFALYSMRSSEVSRLYLQCAPDEDLEEWPDDRVWDELQTRLGGANADQIERADLMDKSITPMRSFVAEPMRFGRMFLAGDAAHIVPPTGAKGLNLAAADVRMLHRALVAHYEEKDDGPLDAYSEAALSRIWKVERFSWWMTSILHRFPENSAFGDKMQLADLDYLSSSKALQTSLAENYVGLPLEL